jgi:hypothetical protein
MCCLIGSKLGDERGIRRAGLSVIDRSTCSFTCCHGVTGDFLSLVPAADGIDLRLDGVGVTGGGDFIRSENDFELSVRRRDLVPRSGAPMSLIDRPFLCSGESSGLASVIVWSCLLLGVRLCFDAGVAADADGPEEGSFGSPNID